MLRDSKDRELAKRIRLLFKQGGEPEFTFAHLLQRLRPSSPDELALALTDLTASTELERVIRVESPETHGGLGDFHSLADVPPEIHDFRTNRTLHVEPENLRVIFRLGHKQGGHGW